MSDGMTILEQRLAEIRNRQRPVVPAEALRWASPPCTHAALARSKAEATRPSATEQASFSGPLLAGVPYKQYEPTRPRFKVRKLKRKGGRRG